MRLTLGQLVRRYLYGVRLGERRVTAIYHGNKLIWPTLSDTVYSAVLDVPSIEHTLAGAQFWHALQAVQRNGASESCYILLNAGGRDYMLLARGFGRYEVAEWDGFATVVFGDNGPLASALKAGDEVTLRLVVPAFESDSYASPKENEGFNGTWTTRWLPGTMLQYSHYKGQKRVCSWASGEVRGRQSGTLYIAAGWHNHQGHGRWDNEHAVEEVPGLVPAYADALFDVSMQVGGSSAITSCKLLFPPFAAAIKVRVSAVRRHE